MTELSRVHIVIPNWNGWRLTLECLRSIQAMDYPRKRVIVVDNGSTDDSIPRLREADLDVRILENGRNLGFGPACNRGIRLAQREGVDYIWILNNDTHVGRSALSEMVALADSDARVAAVGSVVFSMKEPDRVLAWGGGGMSLWTGRPWQATRPTARLRYLTGASLLLRSTALEKTGLFDERFFFLWEDTDLGYRLRGDGWRLAVAEKASVWHDQSATIGPRSRERARHFAFGLVRFARKHAAIPLLPAVTGLLVQLGRAMRDGSWDSALGTLRGWAAGWRERN